MSKELGQRISALLKSNGLQQKELAERIGISETMLSRYIAGTRDPKPGTIANIATALHTTSDYLLGIEPNDFDYPRVRRIIARNASEMTEAEKRDLIMRYLEAIKTWESSCHQSDMKKSNESSLPCLRNIA